MMVILLEETATMIADTLISFKKGLKKVLNSKNNTFNLKDKEKLQLAFVGVQSVLRKYKDFKECKNLGVELTKSPISKNNKLDENLIELECSNNNREKNTEENNLLSLDVPIDLKENNSEYVALDNKMIDVDKTKNNSEKLPFDIFSPNNKKKLMII